MNEPEVACAVDHRDAQGRRIPCPGYPHAEVLEGGEPDRHPSLTAKLYESSTEDRLRAAEIRAAVAEHEAEAYRNQVQALIRSIQRERGVPEEELREGYVVVVHHERDLSEQRVREIIRDEIAQAARAARRRR